MALSVDLNVDKNINEDNYLLYLDERRPELQAGQEQRLNGIPSKLGQNAGFRKVGYNLLRDFYDSDQWLYLKENGGKHRVYNYVFTTVINYQSFLTNEPPEFDINPLDATDDYKIAQAGEMEDLLEDILRENNFPTVFEDAAGNGSLLGDSFIFGPIYNRNTKEITFYNVKRPENICPIWSDSNYNEMEGVVNTFKITIKTAQRLFGTQLKARGITLKPEAPRYAAGNKTGRGNFVGQSEDEEDNMQEMVIVEQFFDEKVMLILINGKVIDFVVHDWGFIPVQHVRNIPHPTRPWGVGDVENILDAQIEYNESASDISDILSDIAYSKIFGKNFDPNSYKVDGALMIDMGEEADIFPDPRRGTTAGLEQYFAGRKQDILSLSQINDVFYAGPRVTNASGRALSILLQGVNNRIKSRQTRWKMAFESLTRNINHLIGEYVNESKQFMLDDYKVDIFFPSVLVRNVTDELNKLLQHVQSQYTTMKNIGIARPKEEQELIKKELSDTQLMIELSRAPQLQMQLQQMMQQGIQNQRQTSGQIPEGQGAAMREDENSGEGISSTRGVSVGSGTTPEGALNQSAQGAGIPLIPDNA